MQDRTEQPADHSRREEPSHSPDGVDLTLIRWMLSLTPAERLEVLQQNIDSIQRLTHGQGGV